MVQHYYRNVHAIVFVYDVTKMSSFENMPGWIGECDQHNLNRDIPRILVGNKCDEKDKIAVNTNLAQKFADSYNMPLFETSAKDDEKANHVDAIFMTLAHKLKNAKPMMPPYLTNHSRNFNTVQLSDSPQKRGLERASTEERNDACSC